MENSIPIELYHVQAAPKFLTNEKTLDLFSILLLEKIAIVLFLDPTPEIDTTLEIIILRVGFHQDHVPDLRLHLGSSLVKYNEKPLKIMSIVLKTFQSRNSKLKLLCIPVKE